MIAQTDYDEIIKQIQAGTLDVVEWLAVQSEDTIRKRIYARVPKGLDLSVGSYEYDAIEPTNTEFALTYFLLRNIILLAFPQNSFGKWLTLAAAAKGVYRKDATYAKGILVITGLYKTVIPAGAKFSNTVSINSTVKIKYYTTQKEVIINENGVAEVPVISDEIGSFGNVSAGEINLNISDIPNLASIKNEKAFTNGVDEETDSSLLERLLERVRNPVSSGNKRAYEQWAKEIAGVESVEVVSLWNGPGTVKVIIIGEEGNAIPDLIDTVKEYLDPKEYEGKGEGKAPVGAIVTVVTVEKFPIQIDIYGLEYEERYTFLLLKENLITSIKNEIAKVKIGGLVRIHYVEQSIRSVKGIKDFQKVLLNKVENNIQISEHLKASVEEVYFNEN